MDCHLLSSQLGICAKRCSAKESAPDVPDAIAVPSGLEPVLFVHAAGSQIYTCSAGADGKFSWTLKGPDAELKDRKDKVIGQHSGGADLETERRQRSHWESCGACGFA